MVQGSVLEDRYRIEQKIGAGGNASVYQAVHIRTGRKLAIKVLDRQDSGAALEKRLHMLKNLHHPGLPMILDVLETESSYLIVMEYVEGDTLQQRIDKGSGKQTLFTVRETLHLGVELGEILKYLHTLPEPLLFQDIKPSNIILRPDGSTALVDLGTLCRHNSLAAMPQENKGTLGFAAPEQFRRKGIQGPETDLYSLGAVLHYALTGVSPAETPFSFERITRLRPDLMAGVHWMEKQEILGLEEILEKCTRFRGEERYQSAEEVIRGLKNPARCSPLAKDAEKKTYFVMYLLAILAVCASLSSVRSEAMAVQLKQEGREYYLKKARKAEPEQAKLWIQEALFLSPGDNYCFSVLLDRMLGDGIFSKEEQTEIGQLLAQRAEGEEADQETLMKQNPEEYAEFCYRMGTASLYLVEGLPDYGVCETWFQDMEQAAEQWNPGEEQEKDEKERLIKRGKTFARICRYRGDSLLGSVQTDQAYSIKVYWQDLTGLLEETLPADELPAAELGLWREILGLLADWPAELKRAGISWKQQEQTEEQISRLVDSLLDSGEAGEYPAVTEQLQQLQLTAEGTERKRTLLQEAEKKDKRRQNSGEYELPEAAAPSADISQD
ncbi:MAG: serine/threonine-protein kinase [Lachnospiraceae bacterium]|nr:serine/threonine-protein kinase [Lachnospiraceae bacterium]